MMRGIFSRWQQWILFGRPLTGRLFVSVAFLIAMLMASAGVQAQEQATAKSSPAEASSNEGAVETGSKAEKKEKKKGKKGKEKKETITDATVWLEEVLPKSIQGEHFLMKDYQWYCLIVVVFLGFIADVLTRQILKWLTSVWFRYVRPASDIETRDNPWKPLGLLAQVLTWYWGTRLIGLPEHVVLVLLVALKFFAVFVAVWTAFRLIDILSKYLTSRAEKTTTKFDDLLIPLVTKTLKALSVCVGVILFADMFDLDWTALIGGIGLGGAAIAFASQDALGNFFGSLTVLTDRPFEIGDWIVTDGAEGTVETVGIRSTRIRTFYNSLVTLPNSRLTTAVVDNMGKRQYRRLRVTLGVEYGTTPEQIESFCEGIRELLRGHPYTRKDYYHVYFNDFSDSSLDILLYCFLECPDWAMELREREQLFLNILRLAERLSVSFAFPTQTLHMFQQSTEGQSALPDLTAPARTGQKIAAEIAGPLIEPADRLGEVEFRGPSDQLD